MVVMVSACGSGAVMSFKLLDNQVGGSVLGCELEYSSMFRLCWGFFLLGIRG